MLFVLGLRHLGTARTGAYFSVAPFVGAILAFVLLGESWTWQLLLAALSRALFAWLRTVDQIRPHALWLRGRSGNGVQHGGTLDYLNQSKGEMLPGYHLQLAVKHQQLTTSCMN
ncbi:hypothetical protein [Paucibacter sp. JuS9]|uniref:hypothetical protein n=1 Tax=Paucibacter sp. JuS9 TaxID=3228748 RepID=UPI0037565A6B